MVLHNLGYLRFLLGDLPAALAAMSEAVAEGSTRDQVALLDRARVLLESGLFREADETLAAAAEVARRERLTQDLGEIELERARCALIAGDVAAARRSALSARARFRRRGSDGWRRSAEVLLLQSDLAAGRPGRRLIEPALQVRREFDLLGLRQQARAAALIAAEAAVDAGDVAQATSLVAEVGRPAAGDPITARLHARFVRAAIRNARGEAAAASREARAGLADLAAYQARFGSIELQAAAAIHGRRLADLDVSIALDGGRAERVLRAAEFARAASNRLPVVRPPGDREAADLLTELRQTAESMRSTQDRDEWIALQGRRRRLEARIASRGWTLEGPGESREVSSVEEIAATAGRLDTALIAFVQSSGGLHAVVVDESLRLRALGPAAPVAEYVRRARADLDVLAQPMLPGPMRAAVLASFQRSMRDLDAALLAPLGVDGRRLVVVSTGVLGQLPWGALPSLTGVPVVVAPSATAWLAAVRARRSRRRRVVVLSGPGVAHADRESKGVAAAWSAADLRTGQAADRRALVTALGGASVVHVAAHGVHNTENAMFSSLRMADGPVFAHELDRTHRTAEHVVLSACELGLATVRPGDEALGLTSVLLRLGTRSVVAGVARVNDEVAAEVMTAYHRALAGGADSAGALAAAVAGTAGAGAAEVAPFVCFGSAWRGPARPAGPKAPRS
jgi:hypothetical protein